MKVLLLRHGAFLLEAADSKVAAATLHTMLLMAAGLIRLTLIAPPPFMGWSLVFAS